MSMQLTEMMDVSQAARDLSKEAVTLALNGEWERAVEANRAILARSPNDLDAMGRLGKALMESAQYGEAKETLEKVVQLAPHKNIAKKNLARLEQLEKAPAGQIAGRRSVVSSQGFVEDGGKAGITILQKTPAGQAIARINSGDPVDLVVQKTGIFAYAQNNEYMGQLDTKLGIRLQRLMAAGNRYEAAVVGVNQRGISVILRETYRDPSMRKVSSFPARARAENQVYLEENYSVHSSDSDSQEDIGGAVDFLGTDGLNEDE